MPLLHGWSLSAALLMSGAALAQPPPATAAEKRVQREARELLERLVAIDTSNGQESAALGPIAERFRKSGVPAEIVESAPGRGNLIARVRGTGAKKPLLLLAHVDVVPVTGQPWTVPPFTLTEKDGYLYGRGVNDDKGMAAAAVAIALEAARTETRLSRDLIVALTAGEETGGFAGVGWLVEHRPELLDAEIGLNEGNGGGLTLASDMQQIEEVDVGLGSKTYQSYRIVSKGRGGHSSVPPSDVTPITTLAVALQRVGAYKFPARVLPATRPAIAAFGKTQKPPLADALGRVAGTSSVSPEDDKILSADPISNAFIRTTCVATMLQGSNQENVLPASVEAIVNCRLLPGDTPESVRGVLVAALGDAKVEIAPTRPWGTGRPMNAEGEVVDAIRRVTRTMWGGVPIVAGFGFGANDGRYLTGRGAIVYGVHPNPTTVEDSRLGYDAHGPDERVSARWYDEGVRWLNALVGDLAR